GQWKDEVLRRWHDQKRRQAAHSRWLVQDKVDHLFLFEVHAEKYKQRLLSLLEIDDADFDEVFAMVLDQARRDHPLPADSVRREVDRVFRDSGIFSWDQLVALRGHKAEAESWYRRAKAAVEKYTMPYVPEKCGVGDAVRDFVRAELADVSRYREDVVLHVMAKTKRQKMVEKELPPSLMNKANAALYEELTTGLVDIQTRWDDANSVVAKLAACKTSMYRFSENVREGRKAADLLTATLDQWLKDDLPKAVVEEVVAQVAARVKSQRWVHNAEAMQAVVDKAILHYMRSGAINKVLDALKQPEAHTAKVVSRLIQTTVQSCYFGAVDFVVASVRDSVVVAAAVAANAGARRSEGFLLALRLELQTRLKRSGTSALVEGLPKTANGLLACDEQGPGIFTDGHPQSVLAKVLRCLNAHNDTLHTSTVPSSSMSGDVINLIRGEAFGAANGVAPRCRKPCPQCLCPCTKTLGHVSTTGDEPHDTYHQPLGLVGGSWVHNNQLAAGSCARLVVDNAYIVLGDGCEESFRNFNKIYPAWALPTVTQPLPLREYIFAKYQTELKKRHKWRVCKSIPASYFHDIDDIARQIDRLIA
ncbi:hypothetical protein ACHHYP_13724, partial [Achlya hypogyna]